MPEINYSYEAPNYWVNAIPYEAVCLHGTAQPQDGVMSQVNWFVRGGADNSVHFIIGKDGSIFCVVNPFLMRKAWGNGIMQNPDMSIPWLADCFINDKNPNNCTISIEHEQRPEDMDNSNYAAFTPLQHASSLWLTHKLLTYFKLPINRNTVIPHRAIQWPGRAYCPGVINIDQYIQELLQMDYNPNPGKFSIGEGAYAEIVKQHWVAQGPEVYLQTKPQSSITACDHGLIYGQQKVGSNEWMMYAIQKLLG